MISIFNRKEILVTYSISRQAETRDILAANGIDYSVKTVGNITRSVGMGPLSADPFDGGHGLSYEYHIYVRKKDYGRAAELIR